MPDLNHLTIAVVGATGAVGAEFLKIVEQRHPQLHSLKLLASSRSAGTKLTVNGKEFTVEETTEDSFKDVDIAFISASTEASRHWAPIAVAAGAVVIDDSSAFRMQDDVPLVVPEVNGVDVTWHQRHHCHPQLLHHAPGDGGPPYPPGEYHQAHHRRHLPVGVRRGRRGSAGTAGTNRCIAEGPAGNAPTPAQADRLQRHSAGRQFPSPTATPGKNRK